MNAADTSLAQEEKGRFSTEPVGYLLGKPGLIALLVAFIFAAWYRQITIAILLGLILSTAALSRLWSRLSLVGVSCQRFISERRAFPGEIIEFKLSVTNRKLLPLPWIQVEDELPLAFASDINLEPSQHPHTGLLACNTAMLWYSEVSWRYQLHCRHRGYYKLGPLVATSGDIFGLYPRATTENDIDHLISYPRSIPLEQLDIPSRYPLGETKAEQRIFEDPTRTIGVRDYTSRDSLRYVHWKASARHQNLQVKVFEPTTTLNVAIFLAVDSFQQNMQGVVQGIVNEEFELGISLAASLANYVLEQHSAAGLFANTQLADSGQPAEIPPGRSADQLVSILEALAKVTDSTSSSFMEFVQNTRGRLSWGTTIAVIASQISPEMSALLTNMVETGYKLMVIQTSDGEHPSFTMHNIQRSDELAGAWQERR